MKTRLLPIYAMPCEPEIILEVLEYNSVARQYNVAVITGASNAPSLEWRAMNLAATLVRESSRLYCEE